MSENRYNGKCKCGQRHSLVSPARKRSIWVNCVSCNKRLPLDFVQGEFNPDHKCDVRCTSAHGNVCRCACGGANHGADHGIANVVAVADRQYADANPMRVVEPPRERQFVGEVGKKIVGEVTITKAKAVSNGKFLFQFRTNDGDKITWFVPDQYTPNWDEGDKLTIRAKVVRHEDDPDWGKSTIVIFVERV